ncbi:phosphotransferase [Bacteriovoracaceae bacterium]|nr:phosphotransferase [Bacteriovoracaceae bacterium]
MKLEVSERLFVEQLFFNSMEKLDIPSTKLKSIERLTGDASTRRYYRAKYNGSSFVICLDQPSKDKTENDFVTLQSFLHENKVSVPQIFDRDLPKGYLLEEDLGDQTLLKELGAVDSIQSEYNLYKPAIDELVKFASLPKTKDLIPACLDRYFDKEKYQFEIDFSLKYFFKLFLEIEDEAIEKTNKLFSPIIDTISQGPFIVTHRDYHSRNLMLSDSGHKVIDFQDARLGIAQYDLTSLLEDCYYFINPQNKEKLIADYYSALKNELPEIAAEESFARTYDYMAIERLFKAIGSFSYIYHHRKDVRYLKYIGFAMEKIKKISFKHTELKDFRKNLFSLYYEY